MKKGLTRALGMAAGLISLSAVAEGLVTETADFSAEVVPEGWILAEGEYLSPEYSNSVSRIVLSYESTGAGQVGDAQLFAIDHANGSETQIASVNTFTTGTAFDFPAASDYRKFRIAANGLAIRSFSVTWRDERLDAPANVTATPLTTDSLEVSWTAVDGASGYEVSVWTNILAGVTEGHVVWEDSFPGATNVASSSRMGDGKFNSCFSNIGWTRSDRAGYSTGEDGTIRIGISDASGWIQTPAIVISGRGMAIRFSAKAEEMNSKSMAIAIEQVSGDEVLDTYLVELSTEMRNFVIPVHGWQSGNCIRFNSLMSGNRKTIIGSVAVLSGHSEGMAMPNILNVIPAGVMTSCTIEALPDSASVYVGVRALSDEGLSSDIS